MKHLHWISGYETGIASIDHDHRRLMEMLNHICDLSLRGAEAAVVSDAMAEFHTLATAHFALEEKIMRDENHPDLHERRTTHYRLLDQVQEIMDGYEDQAYKPVERVPEMLREWLLEAMAIDVKLFAAINEANLRRWGLNRS